jgi:hypothetical protein
MQLVEAHHVSLSEHGSNLKIIVLEKINNARAAGRSQLLVEKRQGFKDKTYTTENVVLDIKKIIKDMSMHNEEFYVRDEPLDDGESRLLERVEMPHAQFFYAELMRRPKYKEKELISHAVNTARKGL